MRNVSGRRLTAAAVLVAIGLLMVTLIALRPAGAAVGIQTASKPEGIESCEACHGVNGITPNPNIPNLAGQKAEYLVAQLKAFKSKDRKNDLMEAIAGQLSEAEMRDLAKYWNGRSVVAVEGQPTGVLPIRSRMTFPTNFPTGFTLYQTVSDNGTMTKRFANDIAIQAARAGKQLPDGSVIVAVNSEAKKDASGAEVAGAVKSYTGMESRTGWGASIPVLLRNENWDYALFDAERVRNDKLNQVQCLACHKPAAADSYVFTMKALHETAVKPAR